jgi:hypothetical protein
LFTYSPVYDHLGKFHILAITNNAAKNQALWHMTIIPATQEVEKEDCKSEASPGKGIVRPCFNKQKQGWEQSLGDRTQVLCWIP